MCHLQIPVNTQTKTAPCKIVNSSTIMADFKVITSDFVKVQITTSKDDVSFNEKRFAKDLTISDLKAKLELITGGSCNTMQLEIYDKDNKHVCNLAENNSLLGSYPVDDGMRLHVVDKFSIRNELDLSGDVPKYECSEEEYSKKSDSVRAFLIKNKLGQYNEDFIKKKEKQEEEDKALAETTPVGSRCKVTVSGAPCRLGTVMYTGLVEGLPGHWIGVKYDEPLGKHNGTFKEKTYFECSNNYGAFVKPSNVECGDFPEDNFDLDEEI